MHEADDVICAVGAWASADGAVWVAGEDDGPVGSVLLGCVFGVVCHGGVGPLFFWRPCFAAVAFGYKCKRVSPHGFNKSCCGRRAFTPTPVAF